VNVTRSKATSRPSLPWWCTLEVARLARPYLRGYRPRTVHTAERMGWTFERALGREARAGFFLGCLLGVGPDARADVAPCAAVTVAIRPECSPVFEDLVRRPESLLRWTHTYIGWLTHRPPRFLLAPENAECLLRLCPLTAWPDARRAHYARNFFIESLALLVRSGLVRRLNARALALNASR